MQYSSRTPCNAFESFPVIVQVPNRVDNSLGTVALLFFQSSYSSPLTPQKSVPKQQSTLYHTLQYKLALPPSKLPSSFRGTWSPMIPCPLPMTHPMMGHDPNVCCHRGAAGRNACSGGLKTPAFAPRMRRVRGPGSRDVVREDRGWRADCDDGRGSRGKAPWRIGSDARRGTRVVAREPVAVAVADDAVTDEVPNGIVMLLTVFGDAVWLTVAPALALKGLSLLGPVPLYRSANTVKPCITCGL